MEQANVFQQDSHHETMRLDDDSDDWDSREALCRQLYIGEGKSLDEVMAVLRGEGFTPSKHALETQFQLWNFPFKYDPANRERALATRIKELWEAATGQKDMLRILADEGFDIRERELMRIRAQNKWLLKAPAGTQEKNGQPQKRKKKEVDWKETFRDGDDEGNDGLRRELEQAIQQEDSNALSSSAQHGVATRQDPMLPDASEHPARREQRLKELQLQSQEKWESKKRRRRTRGWAGLPADPEGPPRFPSETTIDESKAVLRLDNNMYRQLRDHFTVICEEEDIRKKTDVGPERWQTAKDRLINETPLLQHVFQSQDDTLERKQLCLDVICLDVTKRIRTIGTRLTLADVKNLLNMNPEQARIIRGIFYAILKSDGFHSKVETGEEKWQQYKNQWITESDLLTEIFAQGDPDGMKAKALEQLGRDVMKRLRDDQAKASGPARTKYISGPSGGPGPAPPRFLPGSRDATVTNANAPIRSQSVSTSTTTNMVNSVSDSMDALPAADMQIDPSLLLAAEHIDDDLHAGIPSDPFTSNPFTASTPPYAAQAYHPTPSQLVDTHISHQHQQIPVMFQLDRSNVPPDRSIKPQWWMGVLSQCTVEELQRQVREKHPNTSLLSVMGEDEDGPTVVGNDATLRAYLDSVPSGCARFLVRIAFP